MKSIANHFYYLQRREMWEHRGAVIFTPLGLAILMFTLALLGAIGGGGWIGDAVDHSLTWQQQPGVVGLNGDHGSNFEVGDAVRGSLVTAGNILLFVAYIVSIVYAIGTLYNDRKDRSILFWKSLPVRESNQVCSKLLFAGLVIPGVALGVAIVLMFFTALLSTTVLAGSERFTWWTAWGEINFFSLVGYYLTWMPMVILIGIPGFTWFLLASAFAKKSPGIVAFLIPVVLILIELFVFDTTHVSKFIVDAFGLYFLENAFGFNSPEDWRALTNWGYAARFLPSITQVIKMLLLMAVCLPTAIWLRNNRYEL